MPFSMTRIDRYKLGLTRTTTRATSGNDQGVYNLTRFLDYSKSGQAVPGFRTRIEKGLDASSYYSVDKYVVNFESPVTWSVDFHHQLDPSNKHREILTGYPFPVAETFNHLVSPTAAVDAEARSRLYSRLRSERTSVNGFNILGELRETIRMLKKPAAALIEQMSLKLRHDELTVKRIKRLPRSHRRPQWSKAVSGSILELNFGIKPLISDISGIADAAIRQYSGQRLRKQFSAVSDVSSAFSEYQAARSLSPALGSVFLPRETWRNTRTRAGFRYVAGVSLKEESAMSALEGLRVDLGFTFENILPTAWELTPWSFLIDYVTNIGDIIEAGTTDTSNVFYCTKTTFQETVVTQSCQVGLAISSPPWKITALSGPAFRSEIIRTTLTRSVMGKPPIPQLTFTHPGESLSKMANLLSLLDQKRPSIRF